MIALVDNYDSFTHNLAHAFAWSGAEIEVAAASEIDLDRFEAKAAGIVLSAGPGRPESAARNFAILDRFAGRLPIFGVCLGMQVIAHHFGARIVRAPTPVHGRVATVEHRQQGVLAGIPSPFSAMRYHSLVVGAPDDRGDLEVTAKSDDGCIMAIRHAELEIEGVQFHPESFLTEFGRRICESFAERCRYGS